MIVSGVRVVIASRNAVTRALPSGLSSRPKPTAAGEVSARRMRSASPAARRPSRLVISVAPAASARSAGERTVIWNTASSDRRAAGLHVAQQVHEPVQVRAVVEVEAVGAAVGEHRGAERVGRVRRGPEGVVEVLVVAGARAGADELVADRVRAGVGRERAEAAVRLDPVRPELVLVAVEAARVGVGPRVLAVVGDDDVARLVHERVDDVVAALRGPADGVLARGSRSCPSPRRCRAW